MLNYKYTNWLIILIKIISIPGQGRLNFELGYGAANLKLGMNRKGIIGFFVDSVVLFSSVSVNLNQEPLHY